MIEAFIFDMDGTLVDNMHYHDLAWQATLKDFGIDLPLDAVMKKAYGINVEALERFFGFALSPEMVADFSLKKENLYRQIYTPYLKPINGMIEFLEAARLENIPMAIATGSAWRNTNLVVDTINIRHYFKTIITAEQVTHGKPHPESFLEAARRINVSPKNCMVFEDVPNGARAAFNAGMDCTFITTTYPAFLAGSISSVVHCANDYTKLSISEIRSSSN